VVARLTDSTHATISYGERSWPVEVETGGDLRAAVVAAVTMHVAADAGTPVVTTVYENEDVTRLTIDSRGKVERIAAAPPVPEPEPEPVDAPAPAPAPAARRPRVSLAPADAPVEGEDDDEGPTLDDLLASRPAARPGPAKFGWQGQVRRLSGGLVKPTPGHAEVARRSSIASVQRSLNGPKTIVVLNPKGGAYKTTSALQIAATFGIHRGGYTLAWDNNETRGTMGWRSGKAFGHTNTAVDLLRDLDRFAVTSARVGDLDNYVRGQGSAQFDVLASDEDPESMASIDGEAFDQMHATLSRFYRVIVVDTGNNMRASNWRAAVAAADQLVIISSMMDDTAQSAAWLLDGMRSSAGSRRAVKNAVTVLIDTATSPSASDDALSARLHDHFGRLTRAVLRVPHDASLHGGGEIDFDNTSHASREAWLRVTAAIADGLSDRRAA
jgi:putative peptide zinc metalloprotease protein